MSIFDLHAHVLADDEIDDTMPAAQRSGRPYRTALHLPPDGYGSGGFWPHQWRLALRFVS